MTDGDPPDTVGYRRPPRSRQFKPGQSGNPKGRPKGSKNFATALAAELDARIIATENGKRKTITKRQVIAKQLVNKAVAGDPKAIPLLLHETRLHEASLQAINVRQGLEAAEDEMVMASILRRIRMADTELSDPSLTPPASNAPEPEATPELTADPDP